MPRISFGQSKSQKAVSVTLKLRGKLLEAVEQYEEYVKSYEGFKPDRRLLLEKMIEEFTRSDREFRRWRKQAKHESASSQQHEEPTTETEESTEPAPHWQQGGEAWNR